MLRLTVDGAVRILVTGAAASHTCVTEAPSLVTFVRVQVSYISCGGGALKLSGLLIFKRIKLVASKKSGHRRFPLNFLILLSLCT